MRIGGLQKTTLVDFPGKVAATIFTIGCPFRCSYCHNPGLVIPSCFVQPIPEQELFVFLQKRVGQLDGICISGGEPTVHKDLPEFITRIKNMGYLVKLDTNGINPQPLEAIIQDGNVDYFAMDIKGPIDRYTAIVNTKNVEERIFKSVQLIMESGIDYEFRTTVVKPLLGEIDFEGIGCLVQGAKRYFIQNYVKPERQVDQTKVLEPFTKAELLEAQRIVQRYVGTVKIR